VPNAGIPAFGISSTFAVERGRRQSPNLRGYAALASPARCRLPNRNSFHVGFWHESRPASHADERRQLGQTGLNVDVALGLPLTLKRHSLQSSSMFPR
jgi:hypothetical protein